MTKAFLPDYGAIPIDGRYRPAYRLFAGEKWRMIGTRQTPMVCDTAEQARTAARAHVQRILNPEIRSEVTPAVEPIPAILDVDQWRREREEEQRQERDRVLGTLVFVRGKPVPVEKIRRRA